MKSQLVAIDARKWIASRFHPRQFSEKLMLDAKIEKDDTVKLHFLELKRLMEKPEENV